MERPGENRTLRSPPRDKGLEVKKPGKVWVPAHIQAGVHVPGYWRKANPRRSTVVKRTASSSDTLIRDEGLIERSQRLRREDEDLTPEARKRKERASARRTALQQGRRAAADRILMVEVIGGNKKSSPRKDTDMALFRQRMKLKGYAEKYEDAPDILEDGPVEGETILNVIYPKRNQDRLSDEAGIRVVHQAVRALKLIDSVHTVPRGRRIWMVTAETKNMKGRATGQLSVTSDRIPHGLRLPNEGEWTNVRPAIILLKRFFNAKPTTAVHEVGHYLDLEFGPPGVFTSDEAKKHPKMERLLEALRGSQEVAHNNATALQTRKRKFGAYMKNPRELFARSYEQYVATRTNDKSLTETIGSSLVRTIQARATEGRHGWFYYWNERWFRTEIMPLMDDALAELGLRVKEPHQDSEAGKDTTDLEQQWEEGRGEDWND